MPKMIGILCKYNDKSAKSKAHHLFLQKKIRDGRFASLVISGKKKKTCSSM